MTWVVRGAAHPQRGPAEGGRGGAQRWAPQIFSCHQLLAQGPLQGSLGGLLNCPAKSFAIDHCTNLDQAPAKSLLSCFIVELLLALSSPCCTPASGKSPQARPRWKKKKKKKKRRRRRRGESCPHHSSTACLEARLSKF